jgi:hypothetical protein
MTQEKRASLDLTVKFERRSQISPRGEEFNNIDTNILCNLTHKGWRNVPANVEWDCRTTAVWTSKLLVRTSLSNLFEAQPTQNCSNLLRFQRWN